MLLDDITGATCAFSIRQIRSAYAGNCLKVRRSSDDATLDIGFSGGWLDESAITAFVGANDGFIDTWYDQSANGYNAVQPTTTLQPRLVSSGTINKPTPTKSGATARPAARFGFSGVRYLIASPGVSSAANLTIANVTKREGSKVSTFAPVSMVSLSYASVTGGYYMQEIEFPGTSSFGFVGSAGIIQSSPFFLDEPQCLISASLSAGGYCAFKNGTKTLNGTASPVTVSVASYILGGWNGSGVNCSTQESVLWPSDKTASIMSIAYDQCTGFGVDVPQTAESSGGVSQLINGGLVRGQVI